MRIDPRLSAYAAGAAGQAARPSGGQTFSLKTGTARDAARANSAAPLATLDAILMLQEEDPRERRRRQAQRGSDLLDGLDKLKAGLLAGQISKTDLDNLATRLTLQAGPSGDPGLDDALAHIELRVQVELAKLGRA